MEISWDELELEEVQEVLSAYALKCHRMEQEIASLKDTVRKNYESSIERKIQAGYSTNVSFDIVWSETLEKAQKYDALNNKNEES